MKNGEFLQVVSNSFREFVNSGTSRSTAKLKPLHGAMARDLAEKFGVEYCISSQGYGDDKEAGIQGRYIDKKVDITIKKHGKAIAGVAVKFPPLLRRKDFASVFCCEIAVFVKEKKRLLKFVLRKTAYWWGEVVKSC